MRSIKRLPAALCESATTTLKNGRFFAPPRASRITTISGSPPVEKGVILRELRGGWQGKRGRCASRRVSRSANPRELQAQTGEHPRPANTALPFHPVRDRPITIDAPRAIQIDAVFDLAEIVVDDNLSPAQRRKRAGKRRVG